MIMVNAQSTPKAGWEVKTLGEVCEFARGLTYKKTDEVDHSSNAVLRANNVSLETKSLNFDKIKFIHEDIEIPESKKVRNGSLLICTASGSKKHLGKVALIDADYAYAFGGFMGLLTPHENISSKYFFYSLTGKEYENFIAELSDGANINNLKFSQLQEFRITVPPLAEQERIVGILDEAFEGIAAATAQAEKNLHNARELFQTVLQSTFSQKGDDWEETTLGEACEVFTDGDWIESKDQSPSGIRLIQTGNVGDGFFKDRRDKARFISADTLKRLKCTEIFEGDCLISRLPDPVGRSCILPATGELMITAVDCAIVRFKNNLILPQTFIFYSQSPMYLRDVEDLCTGTTRKRISRKNLGSILVPLPPLPTQQAIVEKLDALSEETKALEAIYERKQSALAELKQSLLQKAFAGEL